MRTLNDKELQANEYVFELADITDDEMYLSLGLFKTFDDAKQKLDKCENPEYLSEGYIYEYAEFEVRRRKFDDRDNYKSVLVAKFTKNYGKSDEEDFWTKEYELLMAAYPD